MLSRSDGKDYFHANLSSRVMISDRDFFRRFVNKGKESYQQKASRKWDREAVRSLQLLQWCSCLICKGNTAKPHISLWKSEWRFSAREWKPPICEFPSADKDSPKTRTRKIPEEYGENSKSRSHSKGAKKCFLFYRQNAGSWPRQCSCFFFLDRFCLLLTYHVTQARLSRVSKETWEWLIRFEFAVSKSEISLIRLGSSHVWFLLSRLKRLLRQT